MSNMLKKSANAIADLMMSHYEIPIESSDEFFPDDVEELEGVADWIDENVPTTEVDDERTLEFRLAVFKSLKEKLGV